MVMPEATIRRNFFHPHSVFLLSCSLKQPKPVHKDGTSLTLSYKAVYVALFLIGTEGCWAHGIHPCYRTAVLVCVPTGHEAPKPDKRGQLSGRGYKRLYVSYKAESCDTNPHRKG